MTEQTATVPWTLDGDPEHAMGVSIILDSRVVAVVCPVASRITAEIAERLTDVTVYVASDHEHQRLARRCRTGQDFVVVSEPAP
jgi:competence protein CoiA